MKSNAYCINKHRAGTCFLRAWRCPCILHTSSSILQPANCERSSFALQFASFALRTAAYLSTCLGYLSCPKRQNRHGLQV